MRKRASKSAALVPVQRMDEHGTERHRTCLDRIRQGPVDLLFLGDSITRRWADNIDLWEKRFGRYAAANFGVGADETGNLLWRIQNGELDGISPKLVVLLIGTNNAPRDHGKDIAAAVERIIEIIRRKCPASRILLLGILPRGPSRDESTWTPADGVAAKAIRAANRILSKRRFGPKVRYVDLGRLFLDCRGRTRRDLLPDRLHPGRGGYELLSSVLGDLVDEMMGL